MVLFLGDGCTASDSDHVQDSFAGGVAIADGAPIALMVG
jgi:hypothetical protein